MSETQQIIDAVSNQTKVLLQNHWLDIDDFRNGEESIKLGFSALIKYEGQKRTVETTISFAKRVKDSATEYIDTDQMDLDLPTALVQAEQPAKKRGRPKGSKNILFRKLVSSPSPDPEAA